MQIFHIAEADRWAAAKLAGSYAQSTVDRTLEEEGFLHASREDQWQGVLDRYYADVDKPLVLLVIDTDKLTSPWREDLVGDTTYPHIYGPLNPSAVIKTIPLRESGKSDQTFFDVFLGDVTLRMFLAVAAMLLALVGALIGQTQSDAGAFIGLLAGLAIGATGAIAVYRARQA